MDLPQAGQVEQKQSPALLLSETPTTSQHHLFPANLLEVSSPLIEHCAEA